MGKTDLLRIGQLAKLAKVTPRTIRFYIQEGLLPQPVRVHKTMALYSRDCIKKIKAIKDAQNKQFLPLMVIRKLLEQNNYDYESLVEKSPRFAKEAKPDLSAAANDRDQNYSFDAVCTQLNIPPKAVGQIAGHKWINLERKGKQKRIRPSDFKFLERISALYQNGVDLEEQLHFFSTIQGFIEKGVELELEILIKSLLKKPAKNFSEILSVEEQVVQQFINTIRERRLQQYIKAYAEVMDNAYCASADEGFALPADEILGDLQHLEASIDERFPDVQRLNWLSTGYSCIGDLKRSLQFLRQSLKIAPDNLEAKAKMIWYKRFAKRRQDVKRLKEELIELVRTNPRFAPGHVFLVDWCVLEAFASDSASEILKNIKLCLDGIGNMERANPQNPHEWALVQYTKGRVYATFPLLSDDYVDKGILAFEALLESRPELDKYYADSMPFFPKWLWPNILYVLGVSYLKVGCFSEAKRVFEMARVFNMAFPFRDRLEKGLADADKGLAQGDKCFHG